MRQFIRHPADIPICYDVETEDQSAIDSLTNVSNGGLCFQSDSYIKPGSNVHIRIKLLDPPFDASGMVVWSRKSNNHYETGVQLDTDEAEFSVRMVEQVCHIEHYRRKILTNEGRDLSGEEAAVEWISKYAADFPQ